MTDRPLECSECKKPIAVSYTEVVSKQVVRINMCAACPVLQRKLYGSKPDGASLKSTVEEEHVGGGVCCGTCGMSLESVRSGHPVGCAECYAVFKDALVAELVLNGHVPPSMTKVAKGESMHIGRQPGQVSEISPSTRLIALNEALKEVLENEDYEQAARLRDEIQALKEEVGDDGQA